MSNDENHQAPQQQGNGNTVNVTSPEWSPGALGKWMQMGAVGMVCCLLAWQTVNGERSSSAMQNLLLDNLREMQTKQIEENRANRMDIRDLVNSDRSELKNITLSFRENLDLQRKHDDLKSEVVLSRMDKYQQNVETTQKNIVEVQAQINKLLSTNQKTMEAVMALMKTIESKH